MPRGAKPTPTALKLIRGNPGHRSLPENEPKPNAVTRIRAPKYLPRLARLEYVRVAKILASNKLLTEADTRMLELYAHHYAIWVQAIEDVELTGDVQTSPSGYQIQSASLGIANQASKRMQSLLAEFGMSPSSRARLDVGDNPATGSRFSSLK